MILKFIYSISLLLLVPLLIVDTALASDRCLGVESVSRESIVSGRFAHCQKGDIISVYVMSLKEAKNTSSLHDIEYFSLRKDELGLVCSFEHPIVFVGQTELENTAIRWFDCVFIGQDSDSRFEPSIQKKLNEIKK